MKKTVNYKVEAFALCSGCLFQLFEFLRITKVSKSEIKLNFERIPFDSFLCDCVTLNVIFFTIQ
jgi:hypothetical protein